MTRIRIIAIFGIALAIMVATYVATSGAEQRERAAYCASMGEEWQDAVTLEDGSFMPGQCVARFRA